MNQRIQLNAPYQEHELPQPLLLQRREVWALWDDVTSSDACNGLAFGDLQGLPASKGKDVNTKKSLTISELSKLRHYDELFSQYIIERNLARKCEAELEAARAVVEAGKDLADVMALEGYTGDTVRDFLKALAAYDAATKETK